MKRDEPSSGNEFTAAEIVLNSPGDVVPARTTIAPEGGEVCEAARTAWQTDNMTIKGQMKTDTCFLHIFAFNSLAEKNAWRGLYISRECA